MKLKDNKIKTVVTTGGSMRPLIKGGQELRLCECGASDIDIGDVVLYTVEDMYYVHRVIGKENGQFLIGDDTGMVRKHKIGRHEICGKVLNIPFWAQGYFGYIYRVISSSIFRAGRALKQRIS